MSGTRRYHRGLVRGRTVPSRGSHRSGEKDKERENKTTGPVDYRARERERLRIDGERMHDSAQVTSKGVKDLISSREGELRSESSRKEPSDDETTGIEMEDVRRAIEASLACEGGKAGLTVHNVRDDKSSSSTTSESKEFPLATTGETPSEDQYESDLEKAIAESLKLEEKEKPRRFELSAKRDEKEDIMLKRAMAESLKEAKEKPEPEVYHPRPPRRQVPGRPPVRGSVNVGPSVRELQRERERLRPSVREESVHERLSRFKMKRGVTEDDDDGLRAAIQASLKDKEQVELDVTLALSRYEDGYDPEFEPVPEFEVDLADYEQLSKLEDVKCGVPECILDCIPIKRVTEDGLTCRICLEDVPRNTRVRELECMHRFHVFCIDEWLKTNKSCPICKKEIT